MIVYFRNAFSSLYAQPDFLLQTPALTAGLNLKLFSIAYSWYLLKGCWTQSFFRYMSRVWSQPEGSQWWFFRSPHSFFLLLQARFYASSYIFWPFQEALFWETDHNSACLRYALNKYPAKSFPGFFPGKTAFTDRGWTRMNADESAADRHLCLSAFICGSSYADT